MVRLEIRDACIVNGDHVQPGSHITVTNATAAVLLSMGRAVMATEDKSQPMPEAEPPKPAPRPRARGVQPATPTKED